MKKSRLIYLLVLYLVLTIPILSANAAYGIPATRSRGTSIPGLENVHYSEAGNLRNGANGTLHTSKYPITINGKTYDGFCIDPGNDAPSYSLLCSPIKDEGLEYLFSKRKSGVPDPVFSIALRLYALKIDLVLRTYGQDIAEGKLIGEKAAWIRFHQTDSGATLIDPNGIAFPTNPWNYLYETSTGFGNPASGVLKSGYDLYKEAVPHATLGNEEIATGVQFTNKVYKAGTAEHYIESDKYIDASEMKPECKNCSIVNFDWSGTSGVITVSAECGKDYQIGLSSMETGVYACNGTENLTQTLLLLTEEDTEAKIWDEGKIPCDGEDCCTEDPIEPGWIGGTVHNCCEDGGNSEAHEYDLDKLFCKDEALIIDYYKPKCKTDYYIQEDTGLNEKYCKMYCTERVSVEIPGSISAVSGRYFQLTQTSKGTKSPYVEGFKRCRVRVQYDVWEDDYYDAVQKEVDAYNDFQNKKAYEYIYNDTVNNVLGNTNRRITNEYLKASCKAVLHTYEPDYLPQGCYSSSCRQTCSAPSAVKPNEPTYNKNVPYNLFDFQPALKKYDYYYPVIIDSTGRNKGNNVFDKIDLKDGNRVGTNHANYSASEVLFNEIDTLNAWISSNNKPEEGKRTNTCQGVTAYSYYEVVCTREGTTTAERLGAKKEDADKVLVTKREEASNAKQVFQQATKVADLLEQDIDQCNNYFSTPTRDTQKQLYEGKYKGGSAKDNYDFDASMGFYYTQVYMDNEKGLQVDEQTIIFEEEPGCEITGPTEGPDAADNLKGKVYSGKYQQGFEEMHDFRLNADIDYVNNYNKFQQYQDSAYKAYKIFTHDAKYRAECSWNEGENIYYTLSPNGFVSEGTDFINFTEHGQEYRLHLSTLKGTYETFWNIVGLGSRLKGTAKGKFDDFFKEQGNTCAGESPSETSMFTCKIHVEYEIVLTGYCNGSNGTDTTVNVADCDPYKEGYELFTFKVVDSTNLFPNGYMTDAGEVAYNWTNPEGPGPDTLKEIQARGAADKTYSQENLTYSFILSPTDMGHIKNYNVEANANGGYSDFNMNCSCSGDSCINCKSIFLNELANGNVTYDGQGHSVTGWGNKNTSLDGIRRKYGW